MPYPKWTQLPVSSGCFWVSKYCLKKWHGYGHWLPYKFIISNLSCLLSATWRFFYSSPVGFPFPLVHSFVTFLMPPTSPSTSTLLHQEPASPAEVPYTPCTLVSKWNQYVCPSHLFFPLRSGVLPSPRHPTHLPFLPSDIHQDLDAYLWIILTIISMKLLFVMNYPPYFWIEQIFSFAFFNCGRMYITKFLPC